MDNKVINKYTCYNKWIDNIAWRVHIDIEFDVYSLTVLMLVRPSDEALWTELKNGTLIVYWLWIGKWDMLVFDDSFAYQSGIFM